MRIRSIRPEFWSSEDVAAMDWHTRLVFIGLWSYVDDNGVGRDDERLITAALFPMDMLPRESLASPREAFARVSGALQHLSGHGQITRYTVENRRYLHVTSWTTHQRIDHVAKGRYPLPTCGNAKSSRDPRETLASTPETLAPGEGEKGRRGEGVKDLTPATPSRSYTPEFELFWTSYPRRKNKTIAARAFKTATRTTDPGLITAAAARYASDPNLGDVNFIPYPATWLRAGGWNNGPCDPPPVMNGAAKPSTTDQRVNAAYEAGRQVLARAALSNNHQFEIGPA